MVFTELPTGPFRNYLRNWPYMRHSEGHYYDYDYDDNEAENVSWSLER